MKTLRWGIMGTAKIAREWVIPALQKSRHNEVVAVASRDAQRASECARQLNIPIMLSSYEELLARDDIDAVYNPLPNHLHVPMTIKAVEAGKHVLCEKPLGLNASEVVELMHCVEKAPQIVVMEAFMYRFHPQWQRAIELINKGEIGDVQAVHAHFSYFNRDPNNVRNKPGIGGGGLLDIGCYCVSAARTIFQREPHRVCALLDKDSGFGVDRHSSAVMDFAPGSATFHCSTQSAPSQSVQVTGSVGTLTIENPFYHRGVPSRLLLRRSDEDQTIVIGSHDHYVTQADAFAAAVLNEQPSPAPLADALANMRVLDALFESAEKDNWVDVLSTQDRR